MKSFSLLFLIALILSLVLSGCSAQREKPETETPVSETERWAKALLEAWSSHDFEKILSFYTSDCIFEDVVASKVTNGRDDLRAYFTEIFAGIPDFRIEIKSSFGSGDHVCIEWIMGGMHKGDLLGMPATGKRFSVPGVAVIEMENGKIKREVDYFDGASLMRQLGLLADATASDPFAGTWKLNVAKSKASIPGLIHKSETIKIMAQESGSNYSFDGVDAEGKPFHGTWSGKYDGKYYPFMGNPDADMKSAKIISTTTLEFVYSKDGKEVANWRFTISEDGKTITVTGKGKNEKGQDFRKDLVFDKQ